MERTTDRGRCKAKSRLAVQRDREREGELGPLQMLESALSPGLQCHQSLNDSHDYLPVVLGDKQCLCFISKNIVAAHKISARK